MRSIYKIHKKHKDYSKYKDIIENKFERNFNYGNIIIADFFPCLILNKRMLDWVQDFCNLQNTEPDFEDFCSKYANILLTIHEVIEK